MFLIVPAVAVKVKSESSKEPGEPGDVGTRVRRSPKQALLHAPW